MLLGLKTAPALTSVPLGTSWLGHVMDTVIPPDSDVQILICTPWLNREDEVLLNGTSTRVGAASRSSDPPALLGSTAKSL